MHDAIDLRIDALMAAAIGDRLPLDQEFLEARRLSREAHDALIDTAHRENSLRPDVSADDINLLITRLISPMSGTISPEDDHRLGTGTVSPDGRTLYVGELTTNRIAMADTESLTVTRGTELADDALAGRERHHGGLPGRPSL